MAGPPRQRHRPRRLRTATVGAAGTSAALLLLLALLPLLELHAFRLPIPGPLNSPAARAAAPAPAAYPWENRQWRRRAWVPLHASADDDDDEEEVAVTGEPTEDEAAGTSAPPSPAGGSKNLTAGIPNLLGSRSLGLDWGHKKIGVGLSAGFSERPLGTIPNAGGISGNATKNRPTMDHILSLVRAEGAVRIVMGNPLFRDGTLSPQANSTKTFARQLANRAVELGMAQPWPEDGGTVAAPFIYLWDERLTSQAARVNIKTKAFLHSSSDVDSQAACLVLEDFYRAQAYKAEIVWPDPGVGLLRGGGGAEEAAAGEGDAAAAGGGGSGGGASVAAGGRTHQSYDEWRRAERERYEASRLNFQQASEEGAGGKKKKKEKKKK